MLYPDFAKEFGRLRVCFCCAFAGTTETSKLANRTVLKNLQWSGFIIIPHLRETLEESHEIAPLVIGPWCALILYCLDEINTRNGFHGGSNLFKRVTLSLAHLDRHTHPTCIKPASHAEVSRYCLSLSTAPRLAPVSTFSIQIFRYSSAILRFDTRAHSDDNYAYVTPVEG